MHHSLRARTSSPSSRFFYLPSIHLRADLGAACLETSARVRGLVHTKSGDSPVSPNLKPPSKRIDTLTHSLTGRLTAVSLVRLLAVRGVIAVNELERFVRFLRFDLWLWLADR